MDRGTGFRVSYQFPFCWHCYAPHPENYNRRRLSELTMALFCFRRHIQILLLAYKFSAENCSV